MLPEKKQKVTASELQNLEMMIVCRARANDICSALLTSFLSKQSSPIF